MFFIIRDRTTPVPHSLPLNSLMLYSQEIDIDIFRYSTLLTLQRMPIPFGTRCRSFICGLQERQQDLVR
jgi:hypothetical protein